MKPPLLKKYIASQRTFVFQSSSKLKQLQITVFDDTTTMIHVTS